MILHHGNPVEPLTVAALRSFPHVKGIIVHPEQRWVWMKPAKTGGTSIFRKGLPNGWICGGPTYQPEQYESWLSAVNDAELSKYRVWTIVREPMDRALSALAYFHVNVDDFANDPLRYLSPGLWSHMIPQHLYARYCHVIGSFDDLYGSYRYIADWLGFRLIKKLPHLNRSNPNERGEWNRRIAELIASELTWYQELIEG